MRMKVATDIVRRPEEVFPWIADPDKAMRWQENVRGGQVLEETPEKIGTTFREEIEEDGKILVMTGEITGYVPNQSISFHLDSRIHKVDVTYSIEGRANGCAFVGESTIRWKFPFSLITLIIGGRIRKDILRQTEAEFAKLKELCETQPQ